MIHFTCFDHKTAKTLTSKAGLALALILFAANSHASPLLTVNSFDTANQGHSVVRDGAGNVTSTSFTDTSFPIADTAVATGGGQSATTTIAWSNGSSTSSLDLTMSHVNVQGGNGAQYAQSQFNQLQITASKAIDYNLSGSYDSVFTGSGNNFFLDRTYLRVQLLDLAFNTIFESLQFDESSHTGTNLVIGGSAANTTNVLTGSASGSLAAGSYYLRYFSYILGNVDGTATGTFNATFTDPAAARSVPLPGSVSLLLLGVTGLFGFVRKRRS